MQKALQVLCVALLVATIYASSHSEAPGTAQIPSSDLTDYYVFRSYESGRSDYVTFLLNAYGLQTPYGGPNYFSLSTEHFYEMYVDTNTDGTEDLTFQFIFGNGLPLSSPTARPYVVYDDFVCNQLYANATPAAQTPVSIPAGIALTVGGQSIRIALKVAGLITATGGSLNNLNWREYYSVNVIKGNLSQTNPTTIQLQDSNGNSVFNKPFDYAGENSFGTADQYETYAMSQIATVSLTNLNIAGCTGTGKVWVGQRSDPFWISLGRIFDYLNLIPVAAKQFSSVAINNNCTTNNDLREKNVDTLALEMPIACFGLNQGVMYTWAGVRNLIHPPNDYNQSSHIAGVQVSRLGNPLVNELVIGLIDKDRFSRQHPRLDADGTLGFGAYVLYPTLPEIISGRYLSAVNGVLGTTFTTLAPPTPRTDLATVFLTGIPTVNLGVNSNFIGEVIRVNLSIPAIPRGQQNNLGLAGYFTNTGTGGSSYSDLAGFPNGRRPGDDVTDIALMAMTGVLCTPSFLFIPLPTSLYAFFPTESNLNFCNNQSAGNIAGVPLVDGSPVQDTDFGDTFPYFNTPTPGSYVSGPTSDQTICYPAGQHGRCPLCSCDYSSGGGPPDSPSMTPSVGSSASTSPTVYSTPTCSGSGRIGSWMNLL